MSPTSKQIEYANYIADCLGLVTDNLVTNQDYWKFINENQSKLQAMYDDANDFNYDEHYDSLL